MYAAARAERRHTCASCITDLRHERHCGGCRSLLRSFYRINLRQADDLVYWSNWTHN